MRTYVRACGRGVAVWHGVPAWVGGWVGVGCVCVWVGTVKKIKTVLPVEAEFVYLKQESRLF